MILFENDGLIDIDAVTTMGVSVKDGDTPIGYFGTGFKFAVATLLRNGAAVTLYRGQDRFDFGTECRAIRGRDFQVVTMNGERLGFTTELGKNWKPWMAYRELACNAMDEGGDAREGTPCPADGRTVIAVKGGEIEDSFHKRDHIIIPADAARLHKSPGCEALAARGGEHVFYRGVRASSSIYASLFRYNVLCRADLTEDRTFRYDFQMADPIAVMWMRSSDSAALREILTAPEGTLEHALSWNTCGAGKPSDTWLTVATSLKREGRSLTRPAERVLELHGQSGAAFPTESVNLMPHERSALDAALNMLERAGYSVRSLPLIVADALGDGILGRAHNGTIYISRRAFMGGDLTLAGTILEEWAHITTGHADCTRALQNWLVDAVMSQARRADFAERGVMGAAAE